jgi:tetratricopeptide (TPR) repeat protein
MRDADFLLVGSKREQVFRYAALKEITSRNRTLREDLVSLGLSDIFAVLGFYRMGKKELMDFTEGASINTDDRAKLEYSAPKNLRRRTSELNFKLMEPFLVEAPWLRLNPPPFPPELRHYYLAQGLEANDWHNRALEELKKAIELDPSNAGFYLLQAKILLAKDKGSEAAEAALMALERSPSVMKAILQLSEEFYLQDAKVIYTKAIGMGTKEVLPYLGLGNIALYNNDLKEAAKWFDQGRRIQASHPSVLLAWGRWMLASGEAKRARLLLELSRDQGEESGRLYGALGEAYLKLNLWDQAAESYGKALRYERNNDWRRSMGIALARMGRIKEAEQKYREVLALNSEDAQAWRELAKLGKVF